MHKVYAFTLVHTYMYTYLKKNGTPFLDLFLDQPLGKAEKEKYKTTEVQSI